MIEPFLAPYWSFAEAALRATTPAEKRRLLATLPTMSLALSKITHHVPKQPPPSAHVSRVFRTLSQPIRNLLLATIELGARTALREEEFHRDMRASCKEALETATLAITQTLVAFQKAAAVSPRSAQCDGACVEALQEWAQLLSEIQVLKTDNVLIKSLRGTTFHEPFGRAAVIDALHMAACAREGLRSPHIAEASHIITKDRALEESFRQRIVEHEATKRKLAALAASATVDGVIAAVALPELRQLRSVPTEKSAHAAKPDVALINLAARVEKCCARLVAVELRLEKEAAETEEREYFARRAREAENLSIKQALIASATSRLRECEAGLKLKRITLNSAFDDAVAALKRSEETLATELKDLRGSTMDASASFGIEACVLAASDTCAERRAKSRNDFNKCIADLALQATRRIADALTE